jgi:hypothetical protein
MEILKKQLPPQELMGQQEELGLSQFRRLEVAPGLGLETLVEEALPMAQVAQGLGV